MGLRSWYSFVSETKLLSSVGLIDNTTKGRLPHTIYNLTIPDIWFMTKTPENTADATPGCQIAQTHPEGSRLAWAVIISNNV